jgi:hypothetical protein
MLATYAATASSDAPVILTSVKIFPPSSNILASVIFADSYVSNEFKIAS